LTRFEREAGKALKWKQFYENNWYREN
jgi:hypothetical protein